VQLMETPKYLQILSAYKWLLVFGLLVAIAAGFFAGFTFRDGQIVSRAQQTWLASTTVLLDASRTTLFQSEIVAPAPATPDAVIPETITQNLPDLALIYAYLAASEEIKNRVEADVGVFSDEETITAVSRTTQPSGNEQFPGRLSLPILDIVGVAETPERAEDISRAANEEFQNYIQQRQDEQELAEDVRVSLTTLEEKAAVEGDGSNPAIPVIVVGAGTFLAFLALAFILYGIRSSARSRKAARRTAARRPVKTAKASSVRPTGTDEELREPVLAGDK
jgi:hypothetical protein